MHLLPRQPQQALTVFINLLPTVRQQHSSWCLPAFSGFSIIIRRAELLRDPVIKSKSIFLRPRGDMIFSCRRWEHLRRFETARISAAESFHIIGLNLCHSRRPSPDNRRAIPLSGGSRAAVSGRLQRNIKRSGCAGQHFYSSAFRITFAFNLCFMFKEFEGCFFVLIPAVLVPS